MQYLPKDLLEKFRERAAHYDVENAFCADDFYDLRAAGYLSAAVPEEMGGWGLSLTELSRAQRQLAMYAPATALAVNMHLLWSAVARFMVDRLDNRLDFIFDEIMNGEIFAFGISEAGNESVLLDSFCSAQPHEGDYLISGKKIFTTLSPVWTRLGVHAKTGIADAADSANTGGKADTARVLVGFISREKNASTISHPDPWNTLGMRATQSFNTLLTDAKLLTGDIVAEYEPYDSSDPIILGVSLAFGVLTSSVYAGIADRAIEIASGAVDLDDPLQTTWVTDGMTQHRSAIDSLERLAGDVDRLADREDWSVAVATMKMLVTDEARRAVDLAIRVVGSKAFAADSELARLYRDVLAGIFHPRSAKSLAASLRKSLADQ